MKKVAFICVHNSCRSQVAEALGKHFASDIFECYSAATGIMDADKRNLIFFGHIFYLLKNGHADDIHCLL